MTRTIDQMIQSEVLVCVSSLVSTLAASYGTANNALRDLNDLTEQAFKLAAPIDDWEEAAIQAGWSRAGAIWHRPLTPEELDRERTKHPERLAAWAEAPNAEAACDYDGGCDPYPREVFEHWAVTDWFADKLEAAGEKVDKDFAGLCVWARTTTGQMIAADGVIQRIYAETHQPEPSDSDDPEGDQSTWIKAYAMPR